MQFRVRWGVQGQSGIWSVKYTSKLCMNEQQWKVTKSIYFYSITSIICFSSEPRSNNWSMINISLQTLFSPMNHVTTLHIYLVTLWRAPTHRLGTSGLKDQWSDQRSAAVKYCYSWYCKETKYYCHIGTTWSWLKYFVLVMKYFYSCCTGTSSTTAVLCTTVDYWR